MEANGWGLNIESIIAILFGITAIITIVMTGWAYVYQRSRDLNSAKKSKIIGDHGQFFVRIRP